MTDSISILIVDDHEMVRELLRDRLDASSDMQVVGCASDAEAAIGEAADLRPDVVLMDIDMPGMLSFDAARTIKVLSPASRVVFLSAFFHDRYIEQAIAVQAWGYVTKTEREETLVRAIRSVASGTAYFSPEVQARIVVDTNGVKLARERHSRASTLTAREAEVLRYIARGMSKKELADTMRISVNTVNRHTTNLMTKLDIHDRVQLARFALREGLVSL